MANQTEWDRADAMERGAKHPERPWVCTDRDVWHKNPFYSCPVGQPYPPHPEDDDGGFEVHDDEGMAPDFAPDPEEIVDDCPF